MASNVTLKLFPSKWYRKMSSEELEDARQQLRAYAVMKDLDTGISEVFFDKNYFRSYYRSGSADGLLIGYDAHIFEATKARDCLGTIPGKRSHEGSEFEGHEGQLKAMKAILKATRADM